MGEKKFKTGKDWHNEARKRFGDNVGEWKFVCPSCGHITSIQDWRDVGAGDGEIAFSCIGRHMKDSHDAFQAGKSPCNYAGGGLFRINPVFIERKNVYVFDFAENEDAR